MVYCNVLFRQGTKLQYTLIAHSVLSVQGSKTILYSNVLFRQGNKATVHFNCTFGSFWVKKQDI